MVRHLLRLPALALIVLVAATGCGDDGPSDSDAARAEAIAAAVTDSPEELVSELLDEDGAGAAFTDEDGENMVADALEGDGNSFGMSLEGRGGVFETAFPDLAGFEVDGTTLRLEFADGDPELDSIFDCMVAGAFMEEGETLIVAYPGGEVTCE
ncbi:MAG TPA: hypothetical protein VK866_19940 [Acidimicrobiales bacterium]|nr:hypothetical protein [Acidimicrobiales bacterium]